MAGTTAEKMNLADALLGSHARERGDKVAIFCGEERVTYGQLAANVNRFANVLKEMGVKPTERVMIQLQDSPLFVYAFLGSVKCGAWPVPVNTMLGEEDYRYLLTDSEARVLVTTEDSLAAGIETEHLQQKIFADSRFEAVLASASSDCESHQALPDDMAFWLYSSGSTGRPKPTPHKQRSMLYTSDTYAKHVLGLTEEDICFSVSRLFFAYGLGNSLSFPIRFGASAVLLSSPPSPEKVLETLVTYRPTVFFGVPTMYNSLLKKMNSWEVPGLRMCLSAGEALPPEIYKQWKNKTGLDIVDGIGSTEALHIFISNRPGAVKEGASGSVVPGYEAKVVNEEGTEVETGETGHLIIRGESLTPGYWNRPEQNQEKILADGWFRTGDMYSRDNGHFIYQGRNDDMLKVGGIWVSPIEIEYVLLEHPAVSECAIVGREVEGLIKPFAYVVLHENGSSSNENLASELREFLAARLPKFKRPWGIHFSDDLPKTATGKIQRFKLR